MKLNYLVRRSEAMRKVNAGFVKVVQFKAGRDKKGFAVALAKTYTRREVNIHRRLVNSRDQNRYVSSVKFIDKKLNVEVSCSCPDFMYRWEYALAQVGAAQIIYGNHEAPDYTNPGHKIGLCKHLIALRLLILKKHNI